MEENEQAGSEYNTGGWMAAERSYFNDPHFADELLRCLIFDRQFLKTASHMVTKEDFNPYDKHEGLDRRAVAEVSLAFWEKYKEPVGKMLNVELEDWARRAGMDAAAPTRTRLLEYGKMLREKHKRIAPDALRDRVQQYRMEHQLSLAMHEMHNLVAKGALTTDMFLELARKAVQSVGGPDGRPVDIFATSELERRIARRAMQARLQRFPALLIEPIDRCIRVISRKHLGLVMAPYGRGKSLFFVWLALAYTLQGWNVLYFTLEDPLEDVEDRFDAAVTALPLTRLADMPNRVRDKFLRYRRLMRTRLKVFDGTDGGVSIQMIENIWEQERNRGFNPDVIIVDYDDEIKPREKRTERRMEFADIYRDFRAVIARHDLIGWTASQTGRNTLDMKIITGKHIAEDVSKVRKAGFCMSLGAGDWGEESIYLWIEKNRYDMQHIGANIMTDKTKMIFYDREATMKHERLEQERKVEEA